MMIGISDIFVFRKEALQGSGLLYQKSSSDVLFFVLWSGKRENLRVTFSN